MKIPRMLLLIIVIAAFSVTNVLAVRMIDDPTTSRPTQKQLTTPQVPKIQPQPEEITKEQAAQPENAVEEEQYVTMDFDGVDIKVFIKFIADVTGKNFIVDDKVTGKITVISPTKISLDEAYSVFLSVLEVNGFSTVPSNGIVKVVRSADAITKSIETKMAGRLQREDRMITQIIPLKYADANDMKTLLTPLTSKGTSQLLAYPQSNLLIITDNMSNIRKIQDIIKVVDVTGFAQEVRIFPLTYASAGDLSSKLTQILSEEQTPTRRTVRRTTTTVSAKAETKIIPDERINALIVLASAIDMKEIESLIKELDIPTPTGKEDIHVYYLQYANAEDLASVLSEVPAPESPEAAKAAAAKQTTKTTKESFKISADKETNSLIIYADPYTYKSILDTIKFLDIPRKQVYVKAIIMEVKTTRDFKVGVEWTYFEDFTYDSGERIGGALARTGQSFVTGPGDLPVGPLLGVVGQAITIGDGDSAITFPNMSSFINAMKDDGDVNIISTPQIITMDNKEAEIKVGANVPYVTKEDTDSTNINRTVRTFDYRDVGVTLKLTPQINQQGYIRMELFQEITTLVEGSGEEEFAPTTLKRSATTTVNVGDGQTMVIGGLIGDTLTFGNSRVPLLGDIPILGYLFKTITRSRDRTNLYIFLTPAIIDSDEKTNALYKEKYGEYKSFEKEMTKEKHDESLEP